MKKIYSLLIAGLFVGQAFAGGIVTNSNQSAQFVRLLSRNASTGLDAVYYNPAGLTLLDDGFFFSLNNQTIFQEKTVTTTFPYLNRDTYIGDVTVPAFPSAFAVWKKNKLAVGLGFGPNGGGGSAEYSNGLPSFEMPASMLPAMMTSNGLNTTDYQADINFEGSSVFWGTQINATYAINEMISLSAGVRLINAKNKYKGSMSIMVNPQHPLNPAGSGNMVSAPQFFSTLATAASSAASSLQPVIDGGAGGYTLDQLVGAGMLTAAQAAQLSGGLGAAYNPAMTVAQVQGAYQYNAAVMTGYAGRTADMEVDATQTGLGFTPMFGVNFNFNKKLNIGIKYEMNTKLELTNKSDADKDANGMFLNDSTFRSDIPAILAAGIEYSVMDNMRISASWTHYFDKNADWNGKEKFVDNNFYEVALGLEYDLSEKITLSCGYLHGQTGIGQGYQTDISFSNSSNTVGFGGRLNINENLSVDLGALFTMYTSASENKNYPVSTTVSIPYKETFDKSLMDFSIGVNYRF